MGRDPGSARDCTSRGSVGQGLETGRLGPLTPCKGSGWTVGPFLRRGEGVRQAGLLVLSQALGSTRLGVRVPSAGTLPNPTPELRSSWSPWDTGRD